MNNLGIVASSISGSKIVTSSYESIATVTASGGETSLSFTSIPSTYKSLQIRGISRDTYSGGVVGNSELFFTFNSDSTSNYSNHQLYGNGTSVTSYGQATYTAILTDANLLGSVGTNYYANSITDIIDYASTSKYKTTRTFFGANNNSSSTNFEIGMFSGCWRSTSAITRIDITGDYTFAAGSTFALYGIK